jgi:hypothetical protein
MTQARSNKRMQRRPLSRFLIIPPMLDAAPLMRDVRPSLSKQRQVKCSGWGRKIGDGVPLLAVKNRSSFVIPMWSNNRMQRSTASKFVMVVPVLCAAPADARR